jgi:putative ABC transport system ATP-binding protein
MELTSGLVCHRLVFQWPGKGEARVLDAVDAVFAPGSISLVTGKTGAGKSTLLHLLAGLLRPTTGEVWADGRPVSRWPARHRDPWRRQVGIVFQHLALMPGLTVAENLLLPLIPRDLTWSTMQAEIGRQLAAAELAALAQNNVGTLSGGQRQRLAIARALVGHPRFILADEPTAFQDDGHTARIRSQFHSAARDGAVVLIASHDPRLKESAEVNQQFHLAGAQLTQTGPKQSTP